MIKLDAKTRKILFALDTNSRQSNIQIAKRTKLSKNIVNYQIKLLEKKGLIKEYVSLINTKKLGYSSFRITIKLFNYTASQQEKLLDTLCANDQTFFVLKYQLSTSIVFGFISKEVFSLKKFIKDLKNKFFSIIKEIEFSIYDTIYHMHRTYLSNLIQEKIEMVKDETIVHHDDLDIQILKELAKNSRFSATALAEKFNKPITTIVSRIKSLENKKIIVGYSVILSAEKLGLEFCKLELKLYNPEDMLKLLEISKIIPELISFLITVGNWDAELFFEVDSNNRLERILEHIQKNIPLREINSKYSIKYYKFSYFV